MKYKQALEFNWLLSGILSSLDKKNGQQQIPLMCNIFFTYAACVALYVIIFVNVIRTTSNVNVYQPSTRELNVRMLIV